MISLERRRPSRLDGHATELRHGIHPELNARNRQDCVGEQSDLERVVVHLRSDAPREDKVRLYIGMAKGEAHSTRERGAPRGE